MLMKLRLSVLLNVFFVVTLVVLVYYAFLVYHNNLLITNRFLKTGINYKKANNTLELHKQNYDVWIIFTKVSENFSLKYKFRNLLQNLLNVSSVPLKFHIIIDDASKDVATNQISDVVFTTNKSIKYSFYNVSDCIAKINDIFNVMSPHFSSKPGTYYSDALFYLSLGLYRIAPLNQNRGILLDCDLYFKKDIALLFDEFDKFKSTALFGLAPELTPVYRHILHKYKLKHNTTFGEFYHSRNISNSVHPRGFQGYNSGVVLLNLKMIRNSKEYPKLLSNSSVQAMVSKYFFKSHLGDQDFYTLLGYEYPHLIQTLNCGFNKQLCTWWRDHGYSDIFDYYFKCDHPVVILHGNCNTKIPK